MYGERRKAEGGRRKSARPVATVAVLAIGLSAAVALARPTPPPDEPAEQFDLEVGKLTYAVTPEKPFNVTLPNGDMVAAVLHRRKTRHYAGHGVAFDYPSDMRATLERLAIGIYQITVDSADTPLAVVQAIDGKIDPGAPPGGQPGCSTLRYCGQ